MADSATQLDGSQAIWMYKMPLSDMSNIQVLIPKCAKNKNKKRGQKSSRLLARVEI